MTRAMTKYNQHAVICHCHDHMPSCHALLQAAHITAVPTQYLPVLRKSIVIATRLSFRR